MENKKLIADFAAKKPRALSRLISLAENQDESVIAILSKIWKEKVSGEVVGITGPPGAGKSTLLSYLLAQVAQRNETAAVIAVDPMSSVTGGALLGDRIRLHEHYTNADFFIRSLSSRGKLGGLSLATHQCVDLCLQFGFKWVFVETVGTGQNEIDIRSLAHKVVLILTPESGDPIQALKSGVLDIPDMIVVNKTDRPGAEELARALAERLEFSRLQIPIQLCNSKEPLLQAKCFEEILKVKKRSIQRKPELMVEFVESRFLPAFKEWIGTRVSKAKKGNPYLELGKILQDKNLRFLR